MCSNARSYFHALRASVVAALDQVHAQALHLWAAVVDSFP